MKKHFSEHTGTPHYLLVSSKEFDFAPQNQFSMTQQLKLEMPVSNIGVDKIQLSLQISLNLSDEDSNVRPWESLPTQDSHTCCQCKDKLETTNRKMVSDYEQRLFEKDCADREQQSLLNEKYK